MYDFVDRSVTSLDPRGRLLIWSMRRWVQALAERACPPNAIGPAFAKWNMIGAPSTITALLSASPQGLDARFVRFLPARAEQANLKIFVRSRQHRPPPL